MPEPRHVCLSPEAAPRAPVLSPREVELLVGILGILLGGLALAVLTASVVWTPEQIAAGAHMRALGLPEGACAGCPWCGMSRAFSAISHLRWSEAINWNIGVLIHYPLMVLLAVLGPLLALRNLRPTRQA